MNSPKEGLMFTRPSLISDDEGQDSGIQKLVPRLNKCLDNAGDYVEK